MQQPAQSIDKCITQEERHINDSKSYVRLNIWFGSWKIWKDCGHVSLRIFDGPNASLTDISFYPETNNFRHLFWSNGRTVTHTYDKYQADDADFAVENQKSRNRTANTPDLSLYFYTLNVTEMLAHWNLIKNNSKYCLAASSRLNPCTVKINNCLTMAFNVLESGGFSKLLSQYHLYRGCYDKLVNILPTLGSFIGGIMAIKWTLNSSKFSPGLCFGVMGFICGGYVIGRALGAYVHEAENKYLQYSNNFIVKSLIVATPALLNLAWWNVPHENKDWIITTPQDFASKAIAAYFVEYKTSSKDDQENHDMIRKMVSDGSYWFDFIDILNVRLAKNDASKDAYARLVSKENNSHRSPSR